MKELDILLERFVDINKDELTNGSWPEFESFLALEDDQLWDCMRGSEFAPKESFKDLLHAIRKASSNNA